MKEEQLTDLFKCDTKDLTILDDCQMNMRDLATRYIQKHGTMPTLNNLIAEVFLEGVDMIYRAYLERKRKIYENKLKGLPFSQKEEKDLSRLSIPKDVRFITNLINPRICLVYNTAIYHTYFQKELDTAEELMGFKFTE